MKNKPSKLLNLLIKMTRKTGFPGWCLTALLLATGCGSTSPVSGNVLERVLCEPPVKSFGMNTLGLLGTLCDPGLMYTAYLSQSSIVFSYDDTPNLSTMRAITVPAVMSDREDHLRFDEGGFLVFRCEYEQGALAGETSFARDARGVLTSQTTSSNDQVSEQVTYSYDAKGLLASKDVFASGQASEQVAYIWDGLGRIEGRTRYIDYNPVETIQLSYDGTTLYQWVRTQGSTTTEVNFRYDVRNRLSHWEQRDNDNFTARVDFAYGEDGRLKYQRRTGSLVEEVTYLYDDRGLLSGVSSGSE